MPGAPAENGEGVGMNIARIDPITDPLWQDLIATHPLSSVFHSPDWMRVLVDTYGFEVQACIALDDTGAPVAGIPFCQIEDIRGRQILSLPFSDFCDPLVDDCDQWHALVANLLAEHDPMILRCLHSDIAMSDGPFTLFKQAKWHGVDLQPDLDTLWNNLNGAARRAINKAQRQGVEIRMARHDELRAFYDMHLGIRKRKYHLLAQPYQFFDSIWHHFMEDQRGFLMIAVYHDQIVGAVLYLIWKDTLTYKFNASDPEFLDCRPTDSLIWEGIKFGKSIGCRYLDMGLSDWDQDGLIRFKRKFASEEKAISFLRCTGNGSLPPPITQTQRLLPQLTDLFTDQQVPDCVTEKAGDLLYRFFA